MSKSSGRARLMGKSTSKVAMGPQWILHMPRRSLPAIALAVVAVLAWVGGCSDSSPGPGITTETTPATGLIVSNAQLAAALALPAQASAAPSGSSGSDVVYVALPPGTVPAGTTALVRRAGDASSVATAVQDGGFDPVPITAQTGDSIDVTVVGTSGDTLYHVGAVIAASRPPIVVRTEPPPKKRDVPLNASLVIVFSEPVKPSTLSPSSVQLRRGSISVGGSASLLQGTATSVVFTPAAPLDPNADYRLTVTQAVRDLQGEPLAAADTVDFTTGTATAPPPTLVHIVPAQATIVPQARYQLVVDSLQGFPISWTSGDVQVASVDANGLVTGVSVGTAQVSATVQGVTGNASITVVLPSIEVTTATGGDLAALDPDGYAVTLDGTSATSVGINARVTFTPVSPGAHVVALGGVAAGCTVRGTNPRGVSADAALVRVDFDITCGTSTPPPGLGPTDVIAFVGSDATGGGIFTRSGLGVTRIITDTAWAGDLAWSRDGHRIAFTSRRDGNNEIYVMNADGSGLARVTNDSANDQHPTWSPDGSRLAFASNREGEFHIYITRADGIGPATRIVPDNKTLTSEWSPAWSPDGTRIAFARRNSIEVGFIMDPDGSHVTFVPSRFYAREPAWSPDGSQIAWEVGDSYSGGIDVTNADGTGVRAVPLDENCHDGPSGTVCHLIFHRPSWSSNGRRIAFDWERHICKPVPGFCDARGYPTTSGLGVMLLSDSTWTSVGGGFDPAWRP